jgi:acyl transferase domain-containing protein
MPLADVAWTLQAGRQAHARRRFAVCGDHADAATALAGTGDERRAVTSTGDCQERPIVFMFPGQGGQHLGMGRELHQHAPEFRERVDECCELLTEHLGFDLRTVLMGAAGDPASVETARVRLNHLAVGQPAVFVIEYALARLWMAWGIQPAAVAGHSLGAYAAACVAGVLSLPDALRLVAARGRLAQDLPPGAMLAVPLSEVEVAALLDDDLELAVVNGPAQCVVSGLAGPVEALRARLARRGVTAQHVRTPAAGHSRQVEAIIAEFAEHLRAVTLRQPSVPVVSDTTGRWVTPEELAEAGYWTRHLREPVRFGDALATLFDRPERILLEVGPGRALATLARQHPGRPAQLAAIPTLPHPASGDSELSSVLNAAGQLWLTGRTILWPEVHRGSRRRRVSLPTYPFQRQRYCVDPPARQAPRHGDPDESPLAIPADAGHPSSRGKETAQASLTDLQRPIATAFAHILGLPNVDLHDNFFDLGGDSLVATRLVRALRQSLAVRLDARTVFAAPTVAALAKVVQDLRDSGASQAERPSSSTAK